MPAKNKSGEKTIETILKKNNLKFDRKNKIKLKKDTKKYRIPDFYLPDYNLVVEYFGSWNAPENKKFEKRERNRFMEKVGAYHQSKIHTLYIYPDQLKDAEKIILKATKQISNLPVEYHQPLYWNIPWLKEQKIEQPQSKDFEINQKIENIVKELESKKETQSNQLIKTTITTKKVEITQEPKEHGVYVGNLNKDSFDFKEKKIMNSNFSNILLGLSGLVILLFLIYAVTIFGKMFELIGVAFGLFIFVTTILIILSAIYSIQKNIFNGFIIVGIIFTLLMLIGVLLLGDNVWQLVLTIIIILAIIPTEYYMINANKD